MLSLCRLRITNIGHIENYFVTRSEKSESSVRKKVLSLHSLHFGVTVQFLAQKSSLLLIVFIS